MKQRGGEENEMGTNVKPYIDLIKPSFDLSLDASVSNINHLFTSYYFRRKVSFQTINTDKYCITFKCRNFF